ELAASGYRNATLDYLTLNTARQEVLQVELQIAWLEAELGKTLASLEQVVGVQLNEHPPALQPRPESPLPSAPPPAAPGPSQADVELPVVAEVVDQRYRLPGLQRQVPDADLIGRGPAVVHVRVEGPDGPAEAVAVDEFVEMIAVELDRAQDPRHQVIEGAVGG